MINKKICISLLLFALAFLVQLAPVYGAQKPLATGKPIKIGIIGPMDMRTGNHLFITAQMAAEKINAAGGIKVGKTRRPIELVKITSNEFKRVPDAVAAAERAITADKIDFLIGGIVAEAVSAIQDVTAENSIIYINTSYFVSPSYIVRMQKNFDRYKFCFTTASMEPIDIAKTHIGIVEIAAKAVQKKGFPKPRVAQMVEKTLSGDKIHAATSYYLPQMGMVIAGNWRPSPSASDLRAETAAIKDSNPHIIYTVFSGAGGIVFGKQVAELKIPAIIAGSPAASLFPGKGVDYSVTMMSAASIPVKISNANLAFYKEFLKRSGGELCVSSTHDSIMNLAHCIEKAGSLDSKAIVKAMETTEYHGIAGPARYDPKDHRMVLRKGYKTVYGVQQLPGGKNIVVWPTDAAIKIQPVQIPQWMLNVWKKAK